MERPQHELAAIAHTGRKDRTASLTLVIGIHVVIISALVVGLSSNQIIHTIDQFTVTMLPKKVTAQELPPLPTAVIKAPPVLTAPMPKIEIAVAPPPVVQEKRAEQPPPVPPTQPREIVRTHTLPPYPPLSQRMGEQGTTALTCEIGPDGKPVNCGVTRSSGSERLDEAAASYVKEHYTWEPATRDGKPVAGKAQLNVVWDLKNAQ